MGLQFDVDAFGGKLRANISMMGTRRMSNWKDRGRRCRPFAGADFIDASWFRRSCQWLGSMPATSRFAATAPSRTAQLRRSRGELTGLTWRDRTAEALMLGAALHNRKIQLQEVYIRQKSNEFTLSGEAALPATSSEWRARILRGYSASINQLGEFLALSVQIRLISPEKSTSKGRWIPTPELRR